MSPRDDGSGGQVAGIGGFGNPKGGWYDDGGYHGLDCWRLLPCPSDGGQGGDGGQGDAADGGQGGEMDDPKSGEPCLVK